METQKWKLFFRILGTVSAFALLLFLLSQQDWEEILASIRLVPVWRFAVAICLIIISRSAVLFRWHILLRSAGIPIKFRDSARITFAGLFASNFLPTTIGGDVVRLAMVLRLGSDTVISTASLVVDRIIGMAGMATAASIGLLAVFGTAYEVSMIEIQKVSAFAGLWSKMKGLVLQVLESLKLWLSSPRGLFYAFFCTWIHQLCIYGIVWIMLSGLGEPITFGLTAGLWSLTYFVTLLPISINGFGLQEISMIAIFTTFGGVSIGAAATAALMIRTLQMLASLPGTVFVPDIFF
jgi:uncharacterized membrane protein YbhN (UPF0104 family)